MSIGYGALELFSVGAESLKNRSRVGLVKRRDRPMSIMWEHSEA